MNLRRALLLSLPVLLAVAGLVWLLSRGGGEETTGSSEPRAAAPEEPVPAPPVVEEAPAEPVPTVAVTGLVLDARTGAALAGATVRAGELSTTTDPAGEWMLALPEKGELDVAAAAPGYVSDDVTVEASRLPRGCAPALFLSPVSAEVTGRVVDVHGRPVSGARVNRHDVRRDGTFGPLPAAAGTYRLYATAPGYPPVLRTVLVPPDPEGRIDVTVVLPLPVPVRGVVSDLEGRPLAGAEIRGTGAVAPIRTDAAGRFSFPVAYGSRAFLRFSAEGFEPATRTVRAGASIEIRLRPLGRLAGIVLDADGRAVNEGWVVKLMASPDRVARTDAAGRFSFFDVESGSPSLAVSRNGQRVAYVFVETGEEVEIRLPVLTTYRGIAVDAASGEPLAGVRGVSLDDGSDVFVTAADGAFDLLGPKEDPSVRAVARLERDGYEPLMARFEPSDAGDVRRFSLSPSAAVRLRIVAVDGRVAAGAEVQARGSGVRRRARAGGDGTVTISLPAGAAATVTAEHAVFGTGELAVAAPAEGVEDAGDLVLFPPEGTRTIRVLDEHGRPIPGAYVVPYRRGPVLLPDEAGRVRIPPGGDGFVVRAPGREAVRDPGTDEIALRPGRAVAGTVVDTAGNPIPGATIRLGAEAPIEFPGSAQTDGLGRFELAGLPAGIALPIRAEKPGFYPDAAWAASADGEVRIVLAVVSRIRIRLDVPAGVEPSEPLSFVVMPLDGQAAEEVWPRTNTGGWPASSEVIELPAPSGRVALWIRRPPGGYRVFEPVAVDPTGGGEVVYDFPSPGKLHLTVRNGDGEPVPSAEVRDETTGVLVGWTNEEGRLPDAAANDVPSGTIRLVVFARGFVPALTDRLDLARGARAEVVLSPGVPFQGTVVDRDGRPLPARVRLLGPPRRAAFQTDDAGEFESPEPVAPGPHDVEIRPDGRAPQTLRITVPPDGREVLLRHDI